MSDNAYNKWLLPGKRGTKNLDNWEAAENNKPDNSGEIIREKKTFTAEKAEKNLAESLILAQDERWRRA